MTTIIDVAQQAGVSIKTVSRVMNHEPGVHPATRENVLAVVQRLNYRPKQSARSLAGARSFLIGLLYYDPCAAFVVGVQRGATLACRERGYHLMVESLVAGATDLQAQVDRIVSALRPDGLILTPPLCDDERVLAAVRASNTPAVLIAPGFGQDMACVAMDDAQAAEEVGHLLASLGHERIAFVEGPPDQSASGRRRLGFERALAAHGLVLDPALVRRGDFTFPTGVQAGHALLGLARPPTAVFACNDDMALGVLAEAQRRGIAVPQRLSIIGFDDAPASTLVWPTLSTVRQPVEEMAAAAVQMLVGGDVPTAQDVAAGAAVPARVLAHEVVVRASTSACARAARRGAVVRAPVQKVSGKARD